MFLRDGTPRIRQCRGSPETPQTRSLKLPTLSPSGNSWRNPLDGGGLPPGCWCPSQHPEGAPPHDLKGRGRGSGSTEEAGMVDLGHRPTPGPGPKTIRAYLKGKRQAGARRPSQPDALETYKEYLAARFTDNAHIWASSLYDEVVPLGYGGSYVSFARQLRLARLRPHCEACAGVAGRETIEIEHPAGAEIQWDWFERRRAPWGGTAYVLLGALSHSGRFRGVVSESLDQPHLIEAVDGVLRRLGGTARIWRTDRLATVIVPGTA